MQYGVPRPVGEGDSADFELMEGEGGDLVMVKGTPVCRGVYEGTARVVTRLEDAHTIQKGREVFSLKKLLHELLFGFLGTLND